MTPPLESRPTAVITGATRGLGLETARQLLARGYRVVLTGRSMGSAQNAAQTLRDTADSEGGDPKGANRPGQVIPMACDVSSPQSVAAFLAQVAQEIGGVDVLVNNAGMVPDFDGSGDWPTRSALEADLERVKRGMDNNVYGHLLLIQGLAPGMALRGFGRIVNLSSGMGQLTDMNGGYLGYRLSKTAMNVLTRVFADELRGTGVLINSVCPGWVRTDMGGPGASRTIPEGADTIVWLATLPVTGAEAQLTGGFFRNRKPIPW